MLCQKEQKDIFNHRSFFDGCFIYLFLGLCCAACRSQLSDQGLKLGLRPWKCVVLTIGLPEYFIEQFLRPEDEFLWKFS